MEAELQDGTIINVDINGCTCGDAYISRGLIAPDCAWCNECDGIIQAMQLAYNLGRESKWIKCSERLPEFRIRVNTWDGLIVKDMYFDNDYKWKYTHPENINEAELKASYVTHWQPLPEKPNN